jgi:glycosyltransferase involved in cell wall biosynthesis
MSKYSKKNEVTIVIPNLCFGGAEKVCINLCNEIVNKFKTNLIVVGKDYSLINQLDKRINIIKFNSRKMSYSFFKFLFFFYKYKNTNVISFLNNANLICSICKLFFDFNLIITIHNVLKPPRATSRFRDKIINFLSSIFYRKADHIISISNKIKDDLISHFNLDSKVIYNPVLKNNLENFNDYNDSLILKKYNLKDKNFIINIGSLSEQKNHCFMIEVFKKISKKYDRKYKLLILGDGEKKNEIKKKINKLNLDEDIILLGNIHNPAFFLKNALCFLLTSKWEGLPNVIIEAMNFQKPIIATKCPSGINEVLPYGNLSFYIDPDVDLILEKFDLIVDNKIKIQNYDKILENFKVYNQTLKYIKLLK